MVLAGAGHLSAKGADAQQEARVFHVAVTRPSQRLVIAGSATEVFGR